MIATAIDLIADYKYCIAVYTRKALEVGVTCEELSEKAFVAGTFGGGSVMIYAMVVLRDAIDAFAVNYEKLINKETQRR